MTSHIIKIYERVIRKKLVEYLEQNDLICNKQHGFRSGRSCLTQLLHHFDDVLESLTNNAEFDSIYLDYAKAFDKVDHKLLMKKLHLYGIHQKLSVGSNLSSLTVSKLWLLMVNSLSLLLSSVVFPKELFWDQSFS